jgi:hypothetical protein
MKKKQKRTMQAAGPLLLSSWCSLREPLLLLASSTLMTNAQGPPGLLAA